MKTDFASALGTFGGGYTDPVGYLACLLLEVDSCFF